MTKEIITLLIVSVVGLTKLLTWWLGKPRRLANLRKQEEELLHELRKATVFLDTKRMAYLEYKLKRLRKTISDLA